MKEISKNNILFRDPNTNEWVPIPAVTTGGATAEQVAQIEKNTSDISQLSEEIGTKTSALKSDIDGLKKDIYTLYNQIKQYHQNGGASEPIVASLDYAILDDAVLS